jgi:DNA-binding phage protein
MQAGDRERKLTQARSDSVIRALHVRGLSEAGAARAAALEEADRQLDRIARLLHDALAGGVSMTEIARVTSVSRQTLYELRGRYGDTADLRLAVLQALATQYPATVLGLAEHLGRPESEVGQIVRELMDEGLAEWEFDVRVEEGGRACAMTAAGLHALEQWSFADYGSSNDPRRDA